jgi:hypothetical protein
MTKHCQYICDEVILATVCRVHCLFGEIPQITFWAGHMTLFIHDVTSLFEPQQALNVMLPGIFVEYLQGASD